MYIIKYKAKASSQLG